MKFLTYSFLLVALIGALINEPLKAQEGAASTITQSLAQAYNGFAQTAEYCADLLNPWKLPVRYGKFAFFVGSELYSAISESAAKKEFNDRMGYACLQTVGFVALTASPWLVWKLWGKEAYSLQNEHYAYIRETIKMHHQQLIDPRHFAPSPVHGLLTHNFENEKKEVIRRAGLCRKSSMLYLTKDSTIVNLVNNFYNELEDYLELKRLCSEIQAHCDGTTIK